ncbi:MAG: hypothetical protein KGI73_00445 [Patescibacteria group bacterium]|nr:hypothetical protein [Patescibacteria group bacterium]
MALERHAKAPEGEVGFIEQCRVVLRGVQAMHEAGMIGNSADLQGAILGIQRYLKHPNMVRKQLAKLHLATLERELRDWGAFAHSIDRAPDVPFERVA